MRRAALIALAVMATASLAPVVRAGEAAASAAPASVVPPSVAPQASTALDRYLADLRTLRVTFSQQVLDARGHKGEGGEGTLIVQRPGRFRWEIRPGGDEGGQLLVADGRNLWFLDRDLQQVTVKPMSAALSATPAMLLSASGDIRQTFDVRALAADDGLEWVQVRPKAADADFREARLGFAGLELRRMILSDKLGQQATLVFGHSERNGPVAAAEVQFAPPPGVDVIGKPAG